MRIKNQAGETIDHTLHPGTNKDTLLLLAHGVTGDKDREFMVELASLLSEQGWPTLRFSFTGNGHSEGRFEDSTISKGSSDLRAMLDHLEAQYPNTTFIYIGYSMGAAIGTLTAAKDKRLQVLVSLAGMVHTQIFCHTEFGDVTPDEGCMWDDRSKPLSSAFVQDLTQISNTLTAAESIQQPWLLIHGSEDDVVLPTDSSELYAQLTGPKKHQVIPGTDHSFQGHWSTIASSIHQWLLEHSGSQV